MPPKSNRDAVIQPEDFVSLKYYWKRQGVAFLEARRADGTVLRLKGVTEDEMKYVEEAMKEIDRQIDHLHKMLKQ